MILYHLRCACGHDFDAWFRDSAAYDRQEKRGEVDCPECGSTEVAKAPMAPRIAGSAGKKRGRASTSREIAVPAQAPSEGEVLAPADMRADAQARAVAREILRTMRAMRKHAEETCEDVGERFAEEARAIHYGEAEERGIFGEATLAEAKELIEEDIPVQLLGVKPSRRRKLS